jgi:hypothetical protein
MLSRKRSHRHYRVSMTSTPVWRHPSYGTRADSSHNWVRSGPLDRGYMFTAIPTGKRTVSAACYKDRSALLVESEFQPAMLTTRPRNTFGERHADEPKRRDLSAVLRDFIGRWVAVRDQEVLASADTPLDLVNVLRDQGYQADSVFRVPRDAKEDILGER